MPIQLECPGCKATLHVPDELAGKQGKCIHCGHRITVPGGSPASSNSTSNNSSISGSSLLPTLFESTPESMLRELFRRDQSAMLLVFPTPADGVYDLAKMPEAEIKCIATEDINQARFAQLATSFAQRYLPRRKPSSSSVVLNTEQLLYELKGDKLGMSLDEFKQKYERSGEGGTRLPLCSDTAWGANKAALHSEPWHQKAGIINARTDLPAEDNSPTIAGVKTDLLIYQFIDGKLFRITAWIATDKFHLISEAAVNKYGPANRETQKPRQLIWENPVAYVALTRGTVHPPEPSVLELVYRQLQQVAESRTPTGAADF